MIKFKMIFVTTLLFVTIYQLSAQTIQWAKPYKLIGKTAFNTPYDLVKDKYVMLDNGEAIYAGRKERNGLFTIEKFSYELQNLATNTIEVPKEGDKSVEVLKFFQSEGKIRLAVANSVKGRKKSIFFYEVLSNGKIGNAIAQVDNHNEILHFHSDPSANAASNNVLLLSYEPILVKEPGVLLNYTILSPDLKTKIKEGTFRLPFDFMLNKNGDFEFTQLILGKDNSIHGVCMVPKEKHLKDMNPSLKYEVFSYFPTSGEVKIHNFLSKTTQYLYGARLIATPENQLMITTICNNVGVNYVEGIRAIRFDINSKSIVTNVESSIPVQKMEPIVKAKKSFTNSYEYKYFNLNPDGSMSILLENVYHIFDGYYFNNSLFNIELGVNGKITRFTPLPKFQAMSTPEFHFSVVPFIANDKLNVIYLDIPQNLQTEKPEEMKTLMTLQLAVTVLGSFDKPGNIQRKVLYDQNEDKVLIKPKYYLQVKDGVIVYGEKDSEYYLGKVKF